MVHRASTSCHRTGAQSSPKIFDHRRPLPPHLLQTTVDEADAVDVVVVAAAAVLHLLTSARQSHSRDSHILGRKSPVADGRRDVVVGSVAGEGVDDNVDV